MIGDRKETKKENGAELMKTDLTDQVQVNIPYRMLREGYLGKFLKSRLNPEIGFDASALDAISVPEAEAIAEQIHRAGLSSTFHGPFMDLSPGSPDPEIRGITEKRYGQLASLVPCFKPKTVVCHTGYDHRRYWAIRDQWLESSLEIWRPLALEMQRNGTRLMLENVYEQTPSEMLSLLENLAGCGVGFCLDIGHQAVFSSTPLKQWVKRLAPYLEQLHLHDNMGTRDDHWALGRGNIDIHGLFRDLISARVRPTAVTLEPHREEDLWPSLEYLAPIWPW